MRALYVVTLVLHVSFTNVLMNVWNLFDVGQVQHKMLKIISARLYTLCAIFFAFNDDYTFFKIT